MLTNYSAKVVIKFHTTKIGVGCLQLSFLSVRFLFKSKTKQNKSPKTFIFFVEMQPILSKDSAKNRFSKEKENKLSSLRVSLLIFNL